MIVWLYDDDDDDDDDLQEVQNCMSFKLSSCWKMFLFLSEAWVTFLWGGESDRAVKAAILNSEAAISHGASTDINL